MRIPLDIPPGIYADDTTHSVPGRFVASSHIRWRLGKAETRGGFERIIGTDLTGMCRTVFNWTDKAASLNIAFGTHSALQLFIGGGLYTITPTKALPPVLLANNPLSVVNATPTVTVSAPGHALITGDSIIVSGAVAVGGITPNGTFTVTVTGVSSYTFTFGSNATSTASGGGAVVLITPQRAFAAGLVDGTGGQGYGTGAYSTGNYSDPSTADFYPRTWSLGNFGENLIANPRGGTIYAWTNNTGTVAQPLLNAPAKVTASLISPTDQVFALGCNEEVSGVWNPVCIRHSGIRNNTQWNTATNTTSREYILSGGGRIVSGRVIGSNLLVWTDHSVFLGTFVGSVNQPWRFDQVESQCGLIGPNAAIVVGQQAFWLGPDLQFYAYSLGSGVSIVECPVRSVIADNMAASQGDKVVTSSTLSFQEIRFDYPDARDGSENSRALILTVSGLDTGAWALDQNARTSYVDAGPSQFPIATDPTGRPLWHERGNSDDGAALSWFLETSDTYLDEARTSLVQGIWPDFRDQIGPVGMSIISRMRPQDPPTTTGPIYAAVGQGKVDIRANGRLHRVRYEGSSAPCSIRLGLPLFDITLGGYR